MLAVSAGRLAAQGDCFPPASSNEAHTLAILSVPVAFSGLGSQPTEGITLGLEVATIPTVPSSIATPTFCRPGKGPDNTNPLAALARLRISAGHGDWRFEAGWIPPVEVAGVRSNLVGLSIGRRFGIGSDWMLVPRAHILLGSLRAPITCDESALADSTSECFGGTRSNDRWRPGIGGVDVTLMRSIGLWRPYVGSGLTVLRPRFRVHFVNSVGDADRRRIEVNLSRVAFFAGVSKSWDHLIIVGEAYATAGEPPALRLAALLPIGASQQDAFRTRIPRPREGY